MEVAIIVPLIVFASLVLALATPFYFKHRNQRVVYEALKTSIEKTGTADAKLVAAITKDNIGPNADLRRGILLLALAASLFGIGLMVSSDFPFMAAALAPGLIGAVYIGFHFFVPREPTV